MPNGSRSVNASIYCSDTAWLSPESLICESSTGCFICSSSDVTVTVFVALLLTNQSSLGKDLGIHTVDGEIDDVVIVDFCSSGGFSDLE